jgi:hypothetical protein
MWIFPQFLAIFKGRAQPKISQNLDFSAVSWDFEGGACPNFFKTWTSVQFSWDLEGTDPTKKLVNPQTYPQFPQESERTDPIKN